MPDSQRPHLPALEKNLENLGYAVECRELRACDYGAPTIRKRMFVIARRDGLPIVWPAPTHGPGTNQPYRTAAECIDFSLPCPSIFERKRPLAEATLRRIAKGVKRYVIDAQEPFIVTCNHGGEGFRGQGIHEPFKTITAARDAHGIVTPFLTEHANGSSQRNFSADEPLRTQCAEVKGGHFALVAPTLIQTGYGEREGQAPRALDIHKPLGTVVAGGQKHALVAAFLAQHNTGMVGHHAGKPLSTITARATQQQLVTSHLLKLYGTCAHGQDNREPMPTVTGGGQHIGEVRAFLIKYYGTDQDPQLREPLHTVTTKDRFGIVTVKGEDYVIADIGMRMLHARTLPRPGLPGFLRHRPDRRRKTVDQNRAGPHVRKLSLPADRRRYRRRQHGRIQAGRNSMTAALIIFVVWIIGEIVNAWIDRGCP